MSVIIDNIDFPKSCKQCGIAYSEEIQDMHATIIEKVCALTRTHLTLYGTWKSGLDTERLYFCPLRPYKTKEREKE